MNIGKIMHAKIVTTKAFIAISSSIILSIVLLTILIFPVLAIDKTNSLSNMQLVNVSIGRNSFIPSELNVSAGDQINWMNNDIQAHTVTSGMPLTGPTGEFNSGLIEPNGTFTYSSIAKGEINYYCTPHPWMKGRILVVS
jgi:plastocyanin